MVSKEHKYKLVIIAPNCFYYQVDIYRELARDPLIDLKVYFCSREGLDNSDVVRTFSSDADWGLGEELLDGYESEFLKNYSPRASYLHSFIGLMNWGIWGEIRKTRPDAVILMSWMNPTWWLVVLVSLMSGIPFLLMTDANVQTEYSMPKVKKFIRKRVLGNILFRYCNGFLCSGRRNKELYSRYGVPDHKLFDFAYSSGYQRLIDRFQNSANEKLVLRSKLGIPLDKYLVMFCGRLSEEKNPFQLLEVYSKLEHPDKALVFVGDGPLKNQMQEFVIRNDIPSVYFVGFQNRYDVCNYYLISDLLVLPSLRETWGMVVNEAMCFGLPVIVSDAVGASGDLVVEGGNGFCFESGNDEELLMCLNKMFDMSVEQRESLGSKSSDIIYEWVNRNLGAVVSGCLDKVCK